MKLFLLHFAFLQPLGVPVPGYLIQTEAGKNVLVDTGFPHAFIENPPGPMGPLELQVEMHEEDWVLSRLASIGLKPDDIHYVVCTHFDADHAGSHDLFPHAEFVVQKSHYEAAQTQARFAVVRPQWDAPGLRYRLVDGDTVLLPGIELIETRGHVTGHQSVLVRLPETGPVLLTIDAVPHASMMDADARPLMDNGENEADTRESIRKLAEIVKRDAVSLTVYGHDWEQWPTLKHAPQFYV